MTARRLLLAGGLVMVALVLQVTLLARLPFPGATPDVVLLVVVGLGLAYGPTAGVLTGFAAGAGLDLVPPADHEIGRWALVLTVLGYLAGLAHPESRRSAFLPTVVVAVCAAGSVLLYAAVGALMDDPAVSWAAVWDLLPTAVFYDVVLGAFVVPGVLVLAQRTEPELVR